MRDSSDFQYAVVEDVVLLPSLMPPAWPIRDYLATHRCLLRKATFLSHWYGHFLHVLKLYDQRKQAPGQHLDEGGNGPTHLVNFLTELHAKKVDLFIHQQGIDTTTPGGKALFGMLGIFAERSMIQERVRAGIKRVRANNPGKDGGGLQLK